MKRRAQAKNLFAPFPLVEGNRVNSRDEFIDIFPGETFDETLVIKSLLDKENRKINSEILEEVLTFEDILYSIFFKYIKVYLFG